MNLLRFDLCIIAIVGAIAAGCGEKAPPPIDGASRSDTLWLVAEHPAGDAIRSADTEESLARRFGANNVSPAWLQNGEGDSTFGAFVFVNDPARRLAIRWSDTTATRHAESVEIMGKSSLWHMFPGITLGTTLAKLEQINGGPFDLTGFDWDYGGRIVHWRGGRLDSLGKQPPRRIQITLEPGENGDSTETRTAVGDRIFSSAYPPVRALNAQISSILVGLR